jgi:hypothetical protein
MVVPRKGRRHQETPAAARAEAVVGTSERVEHLILTLDKATHDVLEAVRMDTSGERHQLSAQECLALVDDETLGEVMRGVEEAFEAGLVEGLGLEDEEEENINGDALLSRLLLSDSAERGVLRLGLRQSLLRRLLLRRLLRSRLSPSTTATQQRREPIGDQARNGSAGSH